MQILHRFAGSIQRYSEELSDPDRYRPDSHFEKGYENRVHRRQTGLPHRQRAFPAKCFTLPTR
jgi:hypothetical protein